MQKVPFDAQALAPFATLLEETGDYPEAVSAGTVAGAPVLRLLRPAAAPSGDLVVPRLERHPHSTQTFLPLRVGRWLVVFAPTGEGDQPDAGRLVWALAGPGDALTIRRNVWHAPLTVLDPGAVFAMTMWTAAEGDDGVVADLVGPPVLPMAELGTRRV